MWTQMEAPYFLCPTKLAKHGAGVPHRIYSSPKPWGYPFQHFLGAWFEWSAVVPLMRQGPSSWGVVSVWWMLPAEQPTQRALCMGAPHTGLGT